MKYLLPALFWLASCTPGAGPDVRKIDISLTNSTRVPLEVRAQAGILGRTIRLEPGESWSGWIPPNVQIKAIEIEVKERKVAQAK